MEILSKFFLNIPSEEENIFFHKNGSKKEKSSSDQLNAEKILV